MAKNNTYFILEGLFEPMTPHKIKIINPKNEINLLLSEAVSINRNTKIQVKTMEFITKENHHLDLEFLYSRTILLVFTFVFNFWPEGKQLAIKISKYVLMQTILKCNCHV